MITVLESLISNPFKTSSTGFSTYDNFLNPDDLLYMEKEKNRTGKIVYMSPREYYEICSKVIFSGRHSVDDLKRQREYDDSTLTWMENELENGNQLELPYINYADNGQEGLHRMLVVGNLYGWDKKFPVLVVDVYDQNRENKRVIISDLRNFENRYMDKICEDTLWQNYHIEDISNTPEWIEEYCEKLTENSYEEYEENIGFDCELNNDKLDVWVTKINGIDVLKNSQVISFNINNICTPRSSETDIDDLDLDIDLDNIDLDSLFFK